MATQQPNRPLQHIRHDLHPDLAGRTAIRGEHALHRQAQLLAELDMLAKAEGDALQGGPPDMADAVVQAEPDQRAARRRIVQRGLLAEEIGQQDQAIGARRQSRGQPVEALERRLAACRGCLRFLRRQLSHQPVQDRAGAGHAAIGHEQAGHQVIVQKQPRVGSGRGGREQDVAGPAELQQAVAGPADPSHERGGNVVGGTRDHGRAGGEARGRRGRRAHRADDLVGPVQLRQDVRPDMAQRHQIRRDPAIRQIDEAGFQRPVALDRAASGQAPVDVVIGAEQGRDPPEPVGLMALQPAQLRRHQLLVDAVAGAPDEGGRIDLGGERSHLGAGPAVALLDAPAQQLALGIQQHDRRQHAGDPNRRDRGAGQAGGLQQLRNQGADIRPPLLRRLLGPARLLGMERDRAAGERQAPAFGVDHDADGRGRADVEPEGERHGTFCPAA